MIDTAENRAFAAKSGQGPQSAGPIEQPGSIAPHAKVSGCLHKNKNQEIRRARSTTTMAPIVDVTICEASGFLIPRLMFKAPSR